MKKFREDIWHPLGWRKKLAKQEEEERAAAQLAISQQLDCSASNKDKNNSFKSSMRRPASALGGSSRRRESRHNQKEAVLGVEDITDRNLFLASWNMPEQHRVHTGKGVRGNSSAAIGWHLELDIDALKDLDGTYLPNFS